jgi:ADP-heptose:LPS heptosyltransferase
VADVILPLRKGLTKLPACCERFFDFVYRPLNEDERGNGANKVHLVDGFCAELGVNPEVRQPRLVAPSKLANRIRARFCKRATADEVLVAIHTGPSWGVKEWTAEGWDELGFWLSEHHKMRVVQLGADVHFGLGSARAHRVRGALDLIGKLSLAETIACVQECNLFVGIDSGMLHVAGAVGTPSVGIFGPTDHSLILPRETPAIGVTANLLCAGCNHRSPILHWRNSCPNQIACMSSLTFAHVAHACDEFLRSLEGFAKR